MNQNATTPHQCPKIVLGVERLGKRNFHVEREVHAVRHPVDDVEDILSKILEWFLESLQ